MPWFVSVRFLQIFKHAFHSPAPKALSCCGALRNPHSRSDVKQLLSNNLARICWMIHSCNSPTSSLSSETTRLPYCLTGSTLPDQNCHFSEAHFHAQYKIQQDLVNMGLKARARSVSRLRPSRPKSTQCMLFLHTLQHCALAAFKAYSLHDPPLLLFGVHKDLVRRLSCHWRTRSRFVMANKISISR